VIGERRDTGREKSDGNHYEKETVVFLRGDAGTCSVSPRRYTAVYTYNSKNNNFAERERERERGLSDATIPWRKVASGGSHRGKKDEGEADSTRHG